MIKVADIVDLLALSPELTPTELNTQITGLASLESACEGELSFIASAKHRRALKDSSASIVLVAEKEIEYCPKSAIALLVDDPYLAYSKVSHLFDPRIPPLPSIHPTAVIADNVRLSEDVFVGANVVIEQGATIGAGSHIGALSFIGESAVIGERTLISPRVTIEHRVIIGDDCKIFGGAVIGSSGFGYAPTPSGWSAIAQIGRVVIGNRVEIGANTTIDRGAIDDTVIEDDVIIDNLVQIAHNVRVGSKTAMAAQVGIAGSTTIGRGCTIGGQAGFAGHLDIAEQSHFTGQAMITKGTREPGLYSSGMPAQNNRDWRRLVSRLKNLESFNERLKQLEAKKEQP